MIVFPLSHRLCFRWALLKWMRRHRANCLLWETSMVRAEKTKLLRVVIERGKIAGSRVQEAQTQLQIAVTVSGNYKHSYSRSLSLWMGLNFDWKHRSDVQISGAMYIQVRCKIRLMAANRGWLSTPTSSPSGYSKAGQGGQEEAKLRDSKNR